MAVINKNNYGLIAINNKVLSKMIIEELQKMQAVVYMCNKKGKAIKEKPTPLIDPDYYDSIEIEENVKGSLSVRIYAISRLNSHISDLSKRIFERVEGCFDLFCLEKPRLITISYRGITSEYVSKKNIEVKKVN